GGSTGRRSLGGPRTRPLGGNARWVASRGGPRHAPPMLSDLRLRPRPALLPSLGAAALGLALFALPVRANDVEVALQRTASEGKRPSLSLKVNKDLQRA